MGLRFPPSGFTDRTAARAGVRYASWLRRFGGVVVDALLISMIYYVLGLLLGLVVGPIAQGIATLLVTLAIVEPVALLYATLCLAKLDGQTPGMRVFQIRCVPVRGYGTLSLPQAFTRSLCAVVVFTVPPLIFARAWFLIALPIVAYLWPLIDTRRQTWWDHLAATIVLDDRGW